MFGLTFNKGAYSCTAYVMSSSLSASELDSVATGALSLASDTRVLLSSTATLELKEQVSGRYATAVSGSCSLTQATPIRNGEPSSIVLFSAEAGVAVQMLKSEITSSHKYLSRHDKPVTFSFGFVEEVL
jgi:hypothetical protein